MPATLGGNARNHNAGDADEPIIIKGIKFDLNGLTKAVYAAFPAEGDAAAAFAKDDKTIRPRVGQRLQQHRRQRRRQSARATGQRHRRSGGRKVHRPSLRRVEL